VFLIQLYGLVIR